MVYFDVHLGVTWWMVQRYPGWQVLMYMDDMVIIGLTRARLSARPLFYSIHNPISLCQMQYSLS
jgi:hypothetical protein